MLEKITEVEYNALCPLEETIRILAPEEEWRLLATVVGDEMAAEIRADHPSGNADEEFRTDSNVDETAMAEEAFLTEEEYKDFPAKWML